MLARYFPGKGICYVDSVSVKQKLKTPIPLEEQIV